MATPSGPQTTASPSSVNDLARNRGRGDGDRGIAAAPVVAAAGEQAHLVADAADLQPIAIVLDFVDPVAAGRRLHGAGRNAGRDVSVSTAGIRRRHGPRLPTRNRVWESSQ
jgi:hypothetical protein